MILEQRENPVAVNMYEAASRARAERQSRNYLGMSMIGDACARRIWYSFRGYTPRTPDGRLQMIFSLGDCVEQEVLKWLKGAGYHVEGQQTSFEALGGLFRGHCDGIIDKVTQRKHVLEIKSANARRFSAFKTSGIPAVSPTYAAQLQCYMGYSGLECGVWVVMNKNDCSLYIERANFEREEFVRLENRARGIISANEAPERGFEKGAQDCEWCDYRAACLDGLHIQTERTCGVCVYCRFDGIQPRCTKFDRLIKKWGRVCPEWEFRDEVNVDQVPF